MSLSVELVAVGTELLLGQLVDSNSAYVAQHLADNGIDVFGMHAVGDNQRRIAGAIGAALERADGVITTGGLGPTVDDLTKEAVCDLLAVETELHEPSLAQMQQFFAAFGRTMRENNRKQAEIPRGAHVLKNPRGTAPGFVAFRSDGKFIACMPGVPAEMKPMLVEHVIPFLRERFHVHDRIVTRVLHTIGIGESEIDHRIDDLFRSSENPKIAVLAHEFRCDVKIMAKTQSSEEAHARIEPIEREIRKRLDGHIFGVDSTTIESAVLTLLEQKNRRIALAESCTGGRVAAALTSVPGSSKHFVGGIVAYDNEVKRTQLGVRDETLQACGAVSEETAREMARGARERLGADIGLSITGIAGPSGGTPEKPVGLVWFAIDDKERGARTYKMEFPQPGRDAIQRRSATLALGMAWRFLVDG